MKQPKAPPIYPDLPTEDGQTYRLQKISEIEKQSIKERDTRKALYKKYKRTINITDGWLIPHKFLQVLFWLVWD